MVRTIPIRVIGCIGTRVAASLKTVLFGIAALVPAAAGGAVISIDFDEVTQNFTYSGSMMTAGGLSPLTGQIGSWNQLQVGPGSGLLNNIGIGTDSFNNANSPTISNLQDGSGNSTSVGFTLNPGGADTYATFTYSAGGGNPTDDLGRDVVFLRNGDSSAQVSWEFTGLVANGTYTIRLFGHTDGGDTPNNFADFSVNGGAVQGTNATTNFVTFTGVNADAAGRIFGTVFDTGGASAFSGLQLEGSFAAAAVPSSATPGLALLIVSVALRRFRSGTGRFRFTENPWSLGAR